MFYKPMDAYEQDQEFKARTELFEIERENFKIFNSRLPTLSEESTIWEAIQFLSKEDLYENLQNAQRDRALPLTAQR